MLKRGCKDSGFFGNDLNTCEKIFVLMKKTDENIFSFVNDNVYFKKILFSPVFTFPCWDLFDDKLLIISQIIVIDYGYQIITCSGK